MSIKVPPELANVKPSEAIEAINANLAENMPEVTARNFVMRCMAALGNTAAPRVLNGMLEGYKVRMYVWENTVLGGVVLAAGNSFKPVFFGLDRLTKGAEDGIWLMASPDSTTAASKSAAYTGVLSDRRSTQHAAAVVAAEPRAPAAPAPAPRAARTPRAPAAPRAPAPAPPPPSGPARAAPAATAAAAVDRMSPDEQRAALMSGLQQLLGGD